MVFVRAKCSLPTFFDGEMQAGLVSSKSKRGSAEKTSTGKKSIAKRGALSRSRANARQSCLRTRRFSDHFKDEHHPKAPQWPPHLLCSHPATAPTLRIADATSIQSASRHLTSPYRIHLRLRLVDGHSRCLQNPLLVFATTSSETPRRSELLVQKS